MEREQMALPQKLTLEGRRKLTMNGVSEVVAFDETLVVLQTGLGQLHIQGREMKLKNLAGGQVAVEGHMEALSFEEPKERRSWLGRLLG